MYTLYGSTTDVVVAQRMSSSVVDEVERTARARRHGRSTTFRTAKRGGER